MKNTLLIQLLNTFSKQDWRKWQQYIHADYHCQNKYVRKLADILQQSIKKKNLPTKINIWRQLFPNKTYHEAKLNNYTSDLLEHSYSFLAQRTFDAKKVGQFDFIQQQLIERGLVQQAGRIAKKWSKHLEQTTLQNSDAIYEQYRFHYLQDQFDLRQSNRVFGVHLQQKSLEFDRFYLLQQLTHHAEFLNRKNIVKGDFELTHLDGLLRRYDGNEQNVQDIPSIQIYALIVKMLRGEKSHENFSVINGLIDQYHQCFYIEESQTIYKYLFNFCVKQINSGNTDYYQKTFKLYQALIEKELLLHNDSLSQWTYTNIITVGIRLKEWEWTEDFLKTYFAYLPLPEQHNAYHYNLASLHFERCEYDKALILLNELDFKDAFYQMAAKTIQLKIYYLLDEFEAFDALEAATRQFILRNKQLSEYQKKSNVNFIKLLKKIYHYRQNHSMWNSQKQQDAFSMFNEKLVLPNFHLTNKNWLQLQLDDLKTYAT